MSQQHDFLSPFFEQCKQLKYFCYGCEKTQKALNESFRCCLCDSQSIEQVRQEDLSKFQIYEVDRQMTTSKTPLGFLENAVNECRRVPQSRIRVYETTQYITISLSSSSNIRSSLLQDMMAALFGDEDQDEGVTQDQIQKLTKIKDVHECSICQTSECEEDQESEGKQGKRRDGYKLKCNHTFHAECIEPWLKMKNTCPLCRLSISE